MGHPMSESVYSVHVTRPDDMGAVEIVFRTEGEARAYAEDRSKDFHILAASVTQFPIGVLGARHALAWYLDGVEQPHRRSRPGSRLYPSDGYHAS